MRWLAVLLTMSVGCVPDLGMVEVQGVVRDGFDGGGRADTTLRAFNEAFEEVDQTVSDEAGWFRMEVPAAELIHVELSGEGMRPSTFTGISGSNPRIRVPTGASIAITDAAWQDVLDTWDGCPELGEGGTILAQVEIADVVQENGSPIPVETARAPVTMEDGTQRAACYLGEDGTYDPEASQSGDFASFLVTNVPEGVHDLNLVWFPAGTGTREHTYAVWVPDGGVAPRLPLLVEPPIDLDL